MGYTTNCIKCEKELNSNKDYYGVVTNKKEKQHFIAEALKCPKCKTITVVDL